MTKFKLFMQKYNIELEKNSLDESEYKTFRNWITGNAKRPSLQMILIFYNKYKHDINYDLHGLISCFLSYDLQITKKNGPVIYSVTTNKKMYNSLLCNKIIKELSSSMKILVFDESTYDHVSYVNTPTNFPEKFNISLFKSTKLNDFIMKTNNKNVDLVYLTRKKVMQSLFSYKETFEFIRSFRNFLLELVDYDIILFNFWETEDNANQLLSRISDYLIYIAENSKDSCDNLYYEFINLNNKLTILKSNIDNIYRHINYAQKSDISTDILTESDSIINIYTTHENDNIQILSSDLIDELNSFFIIFKETLNYYN